MSSVLFLFFSRTCIVSLFLDCIMSIFLIVISPFFLVVLCHYNNLSVVSRVLDGHIISWVRLASVHYIYYTMHNKFRKGALAIRRIFSLVDMITKPKFSNCPNIFKIGLFW